MFGAFRRSLLARAPMQRGIDGGMSPRDRLIQQMKERQRKGMLSDPAVYPLMAIVGTAMMLATGFVMYFSLHSSDVRISRKQRQQLMRQLEQQDKIAALDDPFDSKA